MGLPYDDTTEQGMGNVLLATTLRLHLKSFEVGNPVRCTMLP